MTATRQALAELVRFLDAPPQQGCPRCSFHPTSLSDFCDAHRPGRKKEVIDAARAALEASVEPAPEASAEVPNRLGWVLRQDIITLQGVAETLTRAGETVLPIALATPSPSSGAGDAAMAAKEQGANA